MLYTVTLNGNPSRAPDGTETIGMTREAAIVAAVELVRAVCSGDPGAYARVYMWDDNNDQWLVHAHGGIETVDIREN